MRRIAVLLLALGWSMIAGQLPPGMMQMGGGEDDAVESHNAEELTDETFAERLLEYELVRTADFHDAWPSYAHALAACTDAAPRRPAPPSGRA